MGNYAGYLLPIIT